MNFNSIAKYMEYQIIKENEVMKKISKIFLLTTIVFFPVTLASCDSSSPSTEVTKLNYDMSKVKFENKTVTYDGRAHKLEITGTLPNGVSVTYTNNKLVDVGTLEVIATFKGPDMTATLTIVKGEYDLSGITFENKEVSYDGSPHSLEITGTLPEGVTVTYENNNKVDAGTYEVVAKFEGDEKMTATLTILKAEYDMTGIQFNNKIITYDGTPHSLEITGTLPEGVTVTYENNNKVDIGTYEVVAKFKGDEKNYNLISEMKAKLTITPYEYNSGLFIVDGVIYKIIDDHLTVIGSKVDIAGDIVLKNEIEGFPVTEIDERALYYCRGIQSIKVPGSIKVVKKGAFSKCVNLTSVIFEEGTITLESEIFKECTNLNNVKLPSTLKSIGDNSFADCVNLTSISFPKNITSFGKSILGGCTNLTSLTIPFLPNKYLGYLFGGTASSYNPTSVPSTLREVYLTNATIIDENAFYACQKITKIILPSTLETIAANAFYSCMGLSEIIIPESVTTIEKYAFYECNGLTNIDIKGRITNISKATFNNCSKLKTITLPNTLTNVEENSFLNCNALTDVYYYGTATSWSKIGIGAGNESLINATIHYK